MVSNIINRRTDLFGGHVIIVVIRRNAGHHVVVGCAQAGAGIDQRHLRSYLCAALFFLGFISGGNGLLVICRRGRFGITNVDGSLNEGIVATSRQHASFIPIAIQRNGRLRRKGIRSIRLQKAIGRRQVEGDLTHQVLEDQAALLLLVAIRKGQAARGLSVRQVVGH